MVGKARVFVFAMALVGCVALSGSMGRASNLSQPVTPTPTVRPSSVDLALMDLPPSKGNLTPIDPRLIVSNTEGLVGESVVLLGEAYSVEQSPGVTWVLLRAPFADGLLDYEEMFVALMPPKKSLLSRETYCVYGVVAGEIKAERWDTGREVTLPLVMALAMPSPDGMYQSVHSAKDCLPF